MIRDATNDDADALAEIYNYYIRSTVVTFEQDVITGNDVITRIEKVRAAGYSYLVAQERGTKSLVWNKSPTSKRWDTSLVNG